jgi:hypothetical protein
VDEHRLQWFTVFVHAISGSLTRAKARTASRSMCIPDPCFFLYFSV